VNEYHHWILGVDPVGPIRRENIKKQAVLAEVAMWEVGYVLSDEVLSFVVLVAGAAIVS